MMDVMTDEMIELDEHPDRDEIADSIGVIMMDQNDLDLVYEMYDDIAVELLRRLQPLSHMHIAKIVERMDTFVCAHLNHMSTTTLMTNDFLNNVKKDVF
jgi:hypothetical protein